MDWLKYIPENCPTREITTPKYDQTCPIVNHNGKPGGAKLLWSIHRLNNLGFRVNQLNSYLLWPLHKNRPLDPGGTANVNIIRGLIKTQEIGNIILELEQPRSSISLNMGLWQRWRRIWLGRVLPQGYGKSFYPIVEQKDISPYHH